ncbi:Isoflavone 2'-hydroxylase [Acorus calamus]|uniref:Isoflavone 2'-hydroxylase n=1 Tax=Acorus calamus TaxID=4465 RepID=A0AAV9DF02_ACOCL|nr:Isoflavone 2'-hydroxylase [Acorus calamus]
METFHYIAVTVALLLIATTRRLLRPLKPTNPSPPSPLALPIIGHLHIIKKPLHRNLASLSKTYGPILSLRFGSRRVLVVSSPSAAEECLTKNDVVFGNRPRFLAGKHLGYNYTTIAWASCGPLWRNLRRITAVEIFSATRLNSYSYVREEEVRSVVRELASSRKGGEGFVKVELKSVLFGLSLNVLLRMVAGKRFYGEGAVKDSEEARRFREIVEETFLLSGSTNLGDFLPILRVVDFQGMEKRLIGLQKKRDAFLQGLVDEHRRMLSTDGGDGVAEEMRRKTIVDVLLSLRETEPEYYTDEIIKGVIVMLLTAGSDTSALTMEWATTLLLNNPAVMKKARAELEAVVGHERIVEESDLPNLPYLNSIVTETLRMYPPGPIVPAHESTEDCTVGGYHVPRGTILLVNIWAIHMDPKLWDEPTKFKPERFERKDDGKEAFALIPFGAGRRRCPGDGMAMRLVSLALGALIQCFEWERVGEEEIDVTELTGLTMSKALPLEAMYKPLPSMVDVLSRI